MTTRARSFETINGMETLIIYRDRARSPGKRINPACLRQRPKQPYSVISQTWQSPGSTIIWERSALSGDHGCQTYFLSRSCACAGSVATPDSLTWFQCRIVDLSVAGDT